MRGKGPRARDSGRGAGPSGSAPVSGQRRCRAGRRRGVAPQGGGDQEDGRRRGSGGSGGRPVAAGPGRPRDRPPFLGDRTAVPCRPVTRAGARSHDAPERCATRPSEATRGFNRARPWLARTPGPTKPARTRSRAVRVRALPNSGTGTHPDASTRRGLRRGPRAGPRARALGAGPSGGDPRTGPSGGFLGWGPRTGASGVAALRGRPVRPSGVVFGGGLRAGASGAALARGRQTRPRHSSSIVIASAVPGLPSASR